MTKKENAGIFFVEQRKKMPAILPPPVGERNLTLSPIFILPMN